MTIAAFGSAVDTLQPLTDVAEQRDPTGVGVTAIRFMFGTVPVFVSVNDVDELVCANQPPDQASGEQWDSRTNRVCWRRAIGKPVQYVWSMQNQRGFDDGLQIEFGHPDRRGEGIVVQLIAMAARVAINVVIEVA